MARRLAPKSCRYVLPFSLPVLSEPSMLQSSSAIDLGVQDRVSRQPLYGLVLFGIAIRRPRPPNRGVFSLDDAIYLDQ